jgi:transposase InsO family protein
MAFRLVDRERAHHAVSVLCSVLGVTRQGYHAWKRRQPSARQREDDRLKAEILAIYERSRDTYGAPRITGRLRIERGIRIGRKRAARLMRELGIQGAGRGRRGVRTTIRDPRTPAAADHLGRDFTATRPDQKWVADITYIPTHEGWLFLAGVTDCYSRRIVGWSMRDTLEAELVADAIAMAVARRQPPPGVIHHSDRGAQYGSLLVGRTLRDAKIIPSMSRVGDPWDNALMESAVGTLKTELVRRHVFQTRDQARLAVFDYIEAFYNPIRSHSALGYLSPDEYEAEYHQTHAAKSQAA